MWKGDKAIRICEDTRKKSISPRTQKAPRLAPIETTSEEHRKISCPVLTWVTYSISPKRSQSYSHPAEFSHRNRRDVNGSCTRQVPEKPLRRAESCDPVRGGWTRCLCIQTHPKPLLCSKCISRARSRIRGRKRIYILTWKFIKLSRSCRDMTPEKHTFKRRLIAHLIRCMKEGNDIYNKSESWRDEERIPNGATFPTFPTFPSWQVG